MPASHPAFSQNTLENYQFVNRAVLDTVQTFFSLCEPVELIAQNGSSLGPDCQNFCMAKPTQYDVVYKGMKIAGAAQRKRRQGYLHQGTIALARPDFSLLNDVLLSKSDVLAAMMAYSFAPLERVDAAVRQDLEKLLADKLNLALKS
jgi:lipoate-protein ligase A